VRVELDNGHQLMGHSTRATSGSLANAKPGEIVVLEVSTFDLSKGRVMERKQQNDKEQ
jgi:translation initiation factor IF-1